MILSNNFVSEFVLQGKNDRKKPFLLFQKEGINAQLVGFFK